MGFSIRPEIFAACGPSPASDGFEYEPIGEPIFPDNEHTKAVYSVSATIGVRRAQLEIKPQLVAPRVKM